MTAATPRQTVKVGLTGGIASGKTTVAELFSGLGVPVIDTDNIARDVVAPGQPALHEIREHFGAAVLNDDGSLNRKTLRGIVFAEPEKRKKLEAILHPAIRKATLQAISAVSASYCIVVVPLMFETDFHTLLDRVITVDVLPETQLARLMSRDSTSKTEAEKMIASQMNREQRNQLADDIVVNDGEPQQLDKQVLRLHKLFLREATAG